MKRYKKIRSLTSPEMMRATWYYMVEDPNGEWVKWDDAMADRLRMENAYEAMREFDEFIEEHNREASACTCEQNIKFIEKGKSIGPWVWMCPDHGRVAHYNLCKDLEGKQ